MRPGTIAKLAGGGLVVVIAAGAVFLATLDVNQYKGQITSQVKELTGRELTLAGDLSLAPGLHPAIVANGVTFANAPGSKDPAMVTLERVEAQIDLLAALSGTIQVDRLVLVKPVILLETHKGKANWEFTPAATATPATAPGKEDKAAASKAADNRTADNKAPESKTAESNAAESNAAGNKAAGNKAPAAAEGSATALPSFHALSIQDGKLVWRDDKGEQVLTLRKLVVDSKGPDAPLTLAVDAAWGDVPLSVKGEVGSLASLLSPGNTPWPLKLAGTVAGLDVTADGGIARPLEGTGVNLALTLKASSLAGLKPLAGQDLPAIPPLALSTRLKGGGTGWEATDIDLTSGSSKLTGTIIASLAGSRPAITATVRLPQLNLAELLPEEAKAARTANEKGLQANGEAKAVNGKLLSADPLPWSSLKLVDLALDASISKLILPDGMEIDGIAARGKLDNGRLGIDQASAHMGGGTISVNGSIDGSSGTSGQLALTLSASKVVLGTLFEQIRRPDLLTGASSDAKIQLKGHGASAAAIAGSLNGSALVSVGPGKINNTLLDWAGADILNQLASKLNPFSDREPYTEMTCSVLNIHLKDGQASWDQGVAFQTAKMNVVSSGESNLGAETMDIGVKPTARGGVGISAGKLVEMARIGGTWANPQLGLDAMAAVRAAGSIAGAIATGGTSLLAQHLIGVATDDSDPCKTALEGASASSTSSGDSKKASTGSSTATNPAEEAVDAIGKGLGGLFGR